MSTPESTSNETTYREKTINNLKDESVNGSEIMGGGKGSITMPTEEEEAAGINNSGFQNVDDGTVTYNDDGTVAVISDGTIKVS